MNKKYIKKLILETIEANIRASKKNIITESKNFGFTRNDIYEEEKRTGHNSITSHYLGTIKLYQNLEKCFNESLSAIAQTKNETPHEFADKIFPIYEREFTKQYNDTLNQRSPALEPLYYLIHSYVLEAIRFAIVESIAECNFEAVYDGGDAGSIVFQPDRESYEKAIKLAQEDNYCDSITETAFDILRDIANYYTTRYTCIANNPAEDVWGPSVRVAETFMLSPYASFFTDNHEALLGTSYFYLEDLIPDDD